MAGNYKQAVQQAKQDIRSIIAEMEALDKKILEINQSASKLNLGKTTNVIAPMGRTNKLLEEQVGLMQQLTQQIGMQVSAQKRLEAQKRKLATMSEEEKALAKANAAQRRLEAQAALGLSHAYTALVAKQKLARNAYRDALSDSTRSRAEVRRLARAYKDLTTQVNRVQAATSSFSRRSLRGMLSGIRNLMGAFGFAGLAYIIADLGKSFYRLTKQIQRMNFALQTVTKSQRDLTRVNAFLREISEDYGANILTVTDRYTKFLAAAQQSNLSMKETEQIFKTVTKASGVLGLKTDELTGIYLALEQMLSKGKITTEELRRQLGERLPGAFGIMAKSMGVSIAQLDKMLKKGEVISKDVLPAFARELEKAYGIENLERVETLAASQERLGNAWTNFVNSVENGEGRVSKVFMLILDSMTAVIEAMETVFGGDNIWLENLQYEKYKQTIEDMEAIASTLGITIKEAARIEAGDFQSAANLAREEVASIKAEMAQLVEVQQNAERGEWFGSKAHGRLTKLHEELYEANITLAITEGRLQAVNELLGRGQTTGDGPGDGDGDGDSGSKKMKVLKNTVKYWENLIAQYEKEQKHLAQNSHTWNGYAMAIEGAKEQLFLLKSEFEVMEMQGGKVEIVKPPSPLDWEAATQAIVEQWTRAMEFRAEIAADIEEEITKKQEEESKARAFLAKWEANERIKTMRYLTRTFGDFYDIDMGQFEFLIDGKKNNEDQWISAAVEGAQAILNARMKQYEVELAEAQRSRDLIVNDELASEEQKELARRKYREEENRIRNERAKTERENALIGVVVDTAAAVAKTLAVLGPLGIGVIPIIVGIGLAQAALIASQPLPQFAEGHLSGTYKGLAMINDARRSDYQEVVKRRGGGVEVYKDRNQIIGMEKGDKVYKSIEDFKRYNNLNDIALANILSDGRELSFANSSDNISAQFSMMRKDAKSTWSEIKSLAKRPINVNVKAKVELPKTRKYI